MALKIKRAVLERIVHEELQAFILSQLNEAPPGRGTVLDDELPDEVPSPDAAPEEPLPDDTPAPEVGDELPDEELPVGDEPADSDLEADVAGEDEGAEEGTVGAELEGKTIESITMEDDSKIMPGATEVVVTFRENPDALRLLVTKTGNVKVFYKGLHNDFLAPVEQIPGDDEDEMELGAEEDPEELEDVPPLGPDDMGEPPAPPPEDDLEV